MKNQSTLNMSLVLTLVFCTLMSGLVTLQIMWVYAQGNLSQVLNQTGNQTGNQTVNQSLSSAIPGQQGGTPPKTGPS
jgi:hypothetical protein